MIINRALICFVVIAAFFSRQPLAADTIRINITGKVLAAPCAVDVDSVNQDVVFGQLLSTDLKTAGSASVWKPFEVKLINCPVATVKATATFSGTPYLSDNTLYSNGSASNNATNVAIQLVVDADKNNRKGNGSTMTVNIDPVLHAATFPLAARVISPTGNAGSGTINSAVVMTFTYQ